MSQAAGKSAAQSVIRHDLEAILDTLVEGIVTFDARRQVTGINRAASEILGIDRSAALRSDCRGLFGGPACAAPAAGPAADSPGDDERESLRRTLDATGWNVAKAARRLGMSRTTLYERIARFGLTRPVE